MNQEFSYERYQRQIILKEFGQTSQQKLWQAKVLVIGAGGLGCPVLQYLAAAGVGTIGIVDDDTVSLTNLHRQVLYSVNDIGLPKADRATAVLRGLNPDISIIPYNERLTIQNALEIFRSFDIIIDGTDNFSTRYMINDACVLSGKPLIYGAISQFEGQVTIFNALRGNDDLPVNYRDLFPHPPKEDEVLNCAEAGVIGVLPGIIGTMMANETIKLVTGIGESLINRLLTYNALSNQVYELALTPRADTRALIPANDLFFKQMNYDWLCGVSPSSFEIDGDEFDSMLEYGAVEVIDVREPDELPSVHEFPHQKIPLKQIETAAAGIKSGSVIVFCQSGKRSKQAATILSGIFGPAKKVYSLKGGIENWKKKHPALRS